MSAPVFGDPRLPERFWSKVEVAPNGCWQWTASVSGGYGGFSANGTTDRAHRHSYKTLIGEIPHGLYLDHLCRNPGCVNPAHLEPVTQSENIRRGLGPNILRARFAAITHCPQGHPYTPENTRRSGPWNTRSCKTCRPRSATAA